jgi:hypothetical protein
MRLFDFVITTKTEQNVERWFDIPRKRMISIATNHMSYTAETNQDEGYSAGYGV